VAAGSADQNQIRHLRGDGLGAGFADVQARELTFFRDGAPLTQKSPIVGYAVVRRGCTAGDDRRAIASKDPVRVTLVETMRSGLLSSVCAPRLSVT
ncbi:hypothetical protein UA70_11240, partial [Raoultella planticola]